MNEIKRFEFEGKPLEFRQVEAGGEWWATAEEAAPLLGHKSARAVLNLYNRHKAEFGSSETSVIDLITEAGVRRSVRVFSPRGLARLCLLGRTEVSRRLHDWVIYDVMEKLRTGTAALVTLDQFNAVIEKFTAQHRAEIAQVTEQTRALLADDIRATGRLLEKRVQGTRERMVRSVRQREAIVRALRVQADAAAASAAQARDDAKACALELGTALVESRAILETANETIAKAVADAQALAPALATQVRDQLSAARVTIEGMARQIGDATAAFVAAERSRSRAPRQRSVLHAPRTSRVSMDLLASLLAELARVFSGAKWSASTLSVNAENDAPLRRALAAIMRFPERMIDSIALGYVLRSIRDLEAGGRVLRNVGCVHNGAAGWRVEPVPVAVPVGRPVPSVIDRDAQGDRSEERSV